MTATTQARPRLWPLGIALADCLFFGVMFLVGGNSAHSAPVGANAPLAADVTVTVTETAPPPPPVTVIVTTTFFTAATTFTEAGATKVITSVHTNVRQVTNTRFQTQVNHVNSTAVLNVNVTNTNNVNVLTTKQITKPVNVTNSVIVTNTAQQTDTATAVHTVEITAKGSASKPLADRARLAIGAGGIAVTSAAGFGFLMLRRRGRYTS